MAKKKRPSKKAPVETPGATKTDLQVSIRLTIPMKEIVEILQNNIEAQEMLRPSPTAVCTKALVRGLRVMQEEQGLEEE